MSGGFTVCIVDDDPSMRDALETLFEAAGYDVSSYSDGEAFLSDFGSVEGRPGCILLDVRLPGIDGLEVNRAIAQHHLPVPVIMVTAHGDIPMAVSAVRDGAFEFVEKPFDPGRLLQLVRQAEDRAQDMHRAFAEAAEVRQRYVALTSREQEVMKLVVEGLPNKVVAARLGISPRTAETHRARVMEKMDAPSVAALVRLDQLINARNPASD